MKELVIYIHGKGGCAGESEHYKPLFYDCDALTAADLATASTIPPSGKLMKLA